MNFVSNISQATWPVSLTLAKSHLIDIDDDLNDYVTHLIASATESAQEYCWRYFTPTEITEKSSNKSSFKLIYQGEVTEIKHIDGVVENVVSTSLYTFTNDGRNTCIETKDGWPTGGRIEIKYTTGYAADQCPNSIKQAILMTVAEWFERRENRLKNLPDAVSRLLDPYRLFEFK